MGQLFDLTKQIPPIGLQGLPQLGAHQIIRPSDYNLVESASIFTELEVKRAVRLWVPGQRRVLRAVPNHMPTDGASVISRGLFIPSVNGIIDLLAPGKWYINTPIVTAEGTPVSALYSDAAFAVAALDEGSSEDPNAFIALFQPRVYATGTQVAVGVASGTAVAAQVGRRSLYVKNVSTLGQRITLNFGAAAVLDTGITLEVGDWRSWDALTGISEQAVNAIASAAAAALEVQTGT